MPPHWRFLCLGLGWSHSLASVHRSPPGSKPSHRMGHGTGMLCFPVGWASLSCGLHFPGRRCLCAVGTARPGPSTSSAERLHSASLPMPPCPARDAETGGGALAPAVLAADAPRHCPFRGAGPNPALPAVPHPPMVRTQSTPKRKCGANLQGVMVGSCIHYATTVNVKLVWKCVLATFNCLVVEQFTCAIP